MTHSLSGPLETAIIQTPICYNSKVDDELFSPRTVCFKLQGGFGCTRVITLFKLENEVSLPPPAPPSGSVMYDPGPGRKACCNVFKSLNRGAADTKPVPYPLAETEPQTLPSLSRVDRR